MSSPHPSPWRRRSVEEVLDALTAAGSRPTKTGDGWLACCPAHEDTSPSLSVREGEDGALLHCFAGCRTPAVLAALTIPEGVLVPASTSPGSTTRKDLAGRSEAPSEADYAALATWLAERAAALADGSWSATNALEYAARRWGLTAEDCARLGLGLDPGTREVARPEFAAGMSGPPRMVVPFLDGTGAPRGCQGRALSPTAKIRWSGLKGAGWAGLGYFGLDREDRPVIVCEGPGDALTAYGAGYPAVVIAGASRARKAVSLLAPALKGRPVIIAGDNDQAGQLFDRHLVSGLQASPLAIPAGVKDLSAWREGTETGFSAELATAIQAAISGPVVAPALRLLPAAVADSIVVVGGQLDAETTAAIAALRAANDPPILFVRSGRVVRVTPDESGRPVIEEATADIMRCCLGTATRWLAEGRHGLEDTQPTLLLARNVLATGEWPFPPLSGIAEAPTVRPDGTIAAEPGYDLATHLLYWPSSGLRVPPVKQTPTQDDINGAAALIDEALVDFPFESATSRAGAWALLLTPIVRPAIGQPVPLALLDAPQRGTGKSMLVELVASIATGRPAEMMAPADSRHGDDEWRKRITATLLEAPPLIVIDNVEHTLSSAALSAALSAGVVKDRILGGSRNARLVVRTTWCATGNNIKVSADLMRRCYRIRLDAKLARPWKRNGWRHNDLLGWAAANRSELLAAVLTMARGWWSQGCPKPADTPSLAGFQQWADMVGGILAVAGVEGFLGDLDATYDSIDDETVEWEAFLAAWRDRFGDAAIPLSSFETATQDHDRTMADTLPGPLVGYLGTPRLKKALGEALRTRVDRRYGDRQIRVQAAGKHRSGVALWSVVEG